MKIGMSKGYTINCGNFNSAKIEYWEERDIDVADRDKELAKMAKDIDKVIEDEVLELQKSMSKQK